MVKKIIVFFLVIAIVISMLVVPAFAFGDSSVIYDSASQSSLQSYLEKQFVVNVSLVNFTNAAWKAIDGCFSSTGLGSARSLDVLQGWCDNWNNRMNSPNYWGMVATYIITSGFGGVPKARVEYDPSYGVYRLKEVVSGLWLTNSAGHFPYYRPEVTDDTTVTEKIRTGQWVQASNITSASETWHAASYYALNDYASQWSDITNARVIKADGYYWIGATFAGRTNVLCDEYGSPYFYPIEGESVVHQSFNYYTEEGDTVIEGDYVAGDKVYNEGDTNNNQFINIHDNTFQNADGDILNIDNLYYNPETNTYVINAHDEYVYNNTTNEYVTNEYTFEVVYHTNYTSVTYIGQTEEYEDQTYVYYYQLPDGRSSADLTAEDLEQLSLAFNDVTNYARSTEEGSLRGLYHFDGNVEDSSYWSYCTGIDWDYGSSLTYLDEGTFNGSLYLDELSHLFYVNLPNERDLVGDFTIQFRYYQSASSATATTSCISLGNPLETSILKFSGKGLAFPDGSSMLTTPVGSWNEICIMRVDGVLHYYLNGVYVPLTYADTTAYSNRICFYFYTDQKCTRKLDELRIVRGAVYTPGVDYTPSAVPFDSNLSLILPDGDVAVADEILTIVPSDAENYLASVEVSDWSHGVPSRLQSVTSADFGTHMEIFEQAGLTLFYNPDRSSFIDNGAFVTFNTVATAQRIAHSSDNGRQTGFYLGDGLFLSLYGYSPNGTYCNVDLKTDYCLSVVYADGSHDYYVFRVSDTGNFENPYSFSQRQLGGDEVSWFGSVDCSWSAFDGDYSRYGVYIIPKAKTADIVHIELVKGNSSGFTLKWETAYYSSGQLENSPVLAVRSNTPISTYTFGGVRPVYPERGQVWAMIENGRIVSLQQYSGSAWVEVDGRIWTGQRWIPYSSFDVFTLKDLYDIVGGSGDDYEYIYTESGFWKWLQGAWKQMLQKLDAIILALGGDPNALPGDSSGNDPDKPFWQRVKGIFENALAKVIEALLDLITRILDLVLGVLYDLLEFFFEMLTDAVINGIGGFFDALTDEVLLQFFHTEEPLLDEFGQPVLDENGEPVMVPVVQLPAGVAGVFAFVSAAVMVLPEELRLVMFFGIGALFLLAVLKLIRS